MNWTRLPRNEPPWSSTLSWVAALMGASSGAAAMSSSPLVIDGLKILVLGSVIETGRRMFQWIVDRFEFRYAVSAEFQGGDSSYEWLVNYLMTEQVWQTPRTIYVKSKNSQRKWKIPSDAENGQVDYVPNFGAVQFFRWKGYWLDVSRLQAGVPYEPHMGEFDQILPDGPPPSASISLSIYTRDMSVLFEFVEECRLKYLENTKSDIMIYTIDQAPRYGDEECWTSVKTKRRRSLDTLLLDEGVIESLLADAREFMRTEDWYIRTGIPHRRGYLLYGAPGTGKTSTVYTMAGELGLEIYALSLSASGMDDDGLARTVSSLPPKAILLIEDIDCAFPSREELDEQIRQSQYASYQLPRSQVTLSGLLNVLDGIGSDEGKLFFATTNHIDRLDQALVRPGRIDRKIEYKLASRRQAHRLFMRFYPIFKPGVPSSSHSEAKELSKVPEMAEEFARAIPENTFSMAELQGYLLEWKQDPIGALHAIGAWVEGERVARQERAAREQLRREKAVAAKMQQHHTTYEPTIARVGSGTSMKSGPQSKVARPSATSSEITSDVDSDPETQSFDTKNTCHKQTISLGPSKVIKAANGVQVSPQSDSPTVVSDAVVS